MVLSSQQHSVRRAGPEEPCVSAPRALPPPPAEPPPSRVTTLPTLGALLTPSSPLRVLWALLRF